MVKVIALHGAESVGKSTLAAQLANRLGVTWVPEYGREYCEEHGTDLTPQDLTQIADGHQERLEAARAEAVQVLVTDTDWLMTAAWSELLFDTPFVGPPYPLADLYLHLPPDLPWVDDGLRFVGDKEGRVRFDAICRKMLEHHGANWMMLDGAPEARLDQALQAVSELG